jgi:hypothetical protein
MSLINRGCYRAVKTGAEALSVELLRYASNAYTYRLER